MCTAAAHDLSKSKLLVTAHSAAAAAAATSPSYSCPVLPRHVTASPIAGTRRPTGTESVSAHCADAPLQSETKSKTPPNAPLQSETQSKTTPESAPLRAAARADRTLPERCPDSCPDSCDHCQLPMTGPTALPVTGPTALPMTGPMTSHPYGWPDDQSSLSSL